MREIKFRAWDKNTKHLIYEIVALYPMYERGNAITKKGTNAITPPENVILMQYTELKDKNGKEVYEGDIIKIKKFDYSLLPKEEMKLLKKIFPDEEHWSKLTEEKIKLDGNWKVENLGWEMALRPLQNVKAHGVILDKKSVMFGFGKLAQAEYEIIGNIYENPELINETKTNNN